MFRDSEKYNYTLNKTTTIVYYHVLIYVDTS